MAAPSYLYTYQLPIKNSLGEEKVVLLTSSSESSATLLARFYLDFFTIVTRQDGVKVWAGACYVGSANYYMHNTARHGWTRLKEQSTGREYVVFWDAGLNTLGRNTIVATRSKFLNQGMEFDVDAYSAWYVSGAIQVRFREANLSNWTEWFHVMYVDEGQNLTGGVYHEENRFWNLVDNFPDYSVGKTYVVQTKHVNVEGEWLSNEMNVIIRPEAIQMKRGSSPSAAYNSTTLYDVYPDDVNIDIGTRFYEDEGMELPLAGGYHMADGSVTWFQLDSNGYVIAKGVYNPVTNINYNLYVVRHGTSGKVGSIELAGDVGASPEGSGGVYGPIVAIVGTHDGSFGNFMTYYTFSLPADGILAGQTIPISEFGDIDETYSGYNWGYMIYVNGNKISEEWL